MTSRQSVLYPFDRAIENRKREIDFLETLRDMERDGLLLVVDGKRAILTRKAQRELGGK